MVFSAIHPTLYIRFKILILESEGISIDELVSCYVSVYSEKDSHYDHSRKKTMQSVVELEIKDCKENETRSDTVFLAEE